MGTVRYTIPIGSEIFSIHNLKRGYTKPTITKREYTNVLPIYSSPAIMPNHIMVFIEAYPWEIDPAALVPNPDQE